MPYIIQWTPLPLHHTTSYHGFLHYNIQYLTMDSLHYIIQHLTMDSYITSYTLHHTTPYHGLVVDKVLEVLIRLEHSLADDVVKVHTHSWGQYSLRGVGQPRQLQCVPEVRVSTVHCTLNGGHPSFTIPVMPGLSPRGMRVNTCINNEINYLSIFLITTLPQLIKVTTSSTCRSSASAPSRYTFGPSHTSLSPTSGFYDERMQRCVCDGYEGSVMVGRAHLRMLGDHLAHDLSPLEGQWDDGVLLQGSVPRCNRIYHLWGGECKIHSPEYHLYNVSLIHTVSHTNPCLIAELNTMA